MERGYAGASIWDWHKLPDYVSPLYEDYARANASIGINAVLLTNVNANALVLTAPYLKKIAALADTLRPYGIRVHVSARFSAPIEIGGQTTADPLDMEVQRFWRTKADEIYRHIPDFGGFVVKANSEGQPGPADYGRTHASAMAANLLADALAPHGGTVFWRAFVYANDAGEDRAKQAYLELQPLDGAFRDKRRSTGQEWPDRLPASRAVPSAVRGDAAHVSRRRISTDAGVSGIRHPPGLPRSPDSRDARIRYVRGRRRAPLRGAGHPHGAGRPPPLRHRRRCQHRRTDRNWCGHPFAQANWFAFGRLAWDPDLGAGEVADDWIRMTFGNDERLVSTTRAMPMLSSREAVVD